MSWGVGVSEYKNYNLKNSVYCGSGSVVAKNVEPCITYNVFYAPSLYGIRYPIMWYFTKILSVNNL